MRLVYIKADASSDGQYAFGSESRIFANTFHLDTYYKKEVLAILVDTEGEAYLSTCDGYIGDADALESQSKTLADRVLEPVDSESGSAIGYVDPIHFAE